MTMIYSAVNAKGIIAVVVIVTMVSLALNAYLALTVVSPQPKVFSYTVLDVWAYDAQGHLITTRHKVGDIILQNFANEWYAVLAPNSPGGPSVIVTRMDGSTAVVNGLPVLGAYNYPYGYIGVGNDSTAVSPSDYKLGATSGTALLGTARISSSWVNITGNQMNVSFTSSILLSAAANVTEAGLIECSGTTFSTSTSVLLTRDVFSPISIPAGGAIAIKITLVVNA
jgi:hypothetical protein